MSTDDVCEQLAGELCSWLPCINFDPDVQGGCSQCNEVIAHLLSTPPLRKALAMIRAATTWDDWRTFYGGMDGVSQGANSAEDAVSRACGPGDVAAHRTITTATVTSEWKPVKRP